MYTHLLRSIALPSVSVLTDSNFWDLYRNLQKNSAANAFNPSPDYVLDKVRELLCHAYENVALYRERMDACGLRPASLRSLDELQQLAPVTKSDIASNFPDRITDVRQQFTPWRYRATSGTIERLTVIHDRRKRDVTRAADLLALKMASGYEPGRKLAEIPPDICRNVCGASNTVEPNIFRFLLDNLAAGRFRDPEFMSDLRGLVERQIIFRRLTLPSFNSQGAVQPDETLAEYLTNIREFQPDILKALPVYLYVLALHILDTRSTPPRIPGGILPMGASMTPHMKQVVERAFGCRVNEDYGCAELGAIGAECGRQNGIHPFASLFHVEVIRDGQPARSGELGRVLITDLSNFAMPFIRYEIGDVAVLRNGGCGCGSSSPRLEVQGRLQDCIPSGNGLVSSDTVSDALFACPGIRLFQLHMRGDDIDIQIVPDRDRAPDDACITLALERLLGRRLRITWRLVRTIIPEASGKFRLVKTSNAMAGELV
jgi:phenylacetate-CoA ligase